MAETSSAVDSSGTVKTQSPQQDPTPKAAAKKAASPSAKRAGVSESKAQKGTAGRPVTKFSDAAMNPNERTHVGEDPTGEKNVSK